MGYFTAYQNLFDQDPGTDDIWIGACTAVFELEELVPFRFGGLQYFVIFSHPRAAIAGSDVPTYAEIWTGGYIPLEGSRLVKFARADAQDKEFDPGGWKLDRAHQIFQFGEILAEIIAAYVRARADVVQYFYIPSTDQLAVLYNRLYKKRPAGCPLLDFERILLPKMEVNLYGYQRKQAAEHASVGT